MYFIDSVTTRLLRSSGKGKRKCKLKHLLPVQTANTSNYIIFSFALNNRGLTNSFARSSHLYVMKVTLTCMKIFLFPFIQSTIVCYVLHIFYISLFGLECYLSNIFNFSVPTNIHSSKR